jgi:hypothetical protein
MPDGPSLWRSRHLLAGAAVLLVLPFACGGRGDGGAVAIPERRDIGVDGATLSPVVDHPFVAFAQVKRTVHEGVEIDEGEELEIRVESTVGATRTVAGVEARVVHVLDYEDGELVEDTEDYYAQDAGGVVYYLGESVDEYEDGKLSGHGGAWLAGTDGALAGVFMPAEPEVGDGFEQERAPGVAEDESTVVAVDVTVTVPAGTFDGCLETEDLDPIDGVTERKSYCPGVGLVKEAFAEGGTLELVEYDPA